MSVSVTAATGREERARGGRPIGFDRLAGVGGLVFVATLVVQNILRAKAPGFDASPDQVSSYFVHHRAAVLVPLGLFPIGMLAIFTFVAGLWTRATGTAVRGWAAVGALGATAIAALFAAVNIAEIVLAAHAGGLAPSPAVVQSLWSLRGAAFGLDLAAIAVALIGLSNAAASMRLIPAWVRVAAVPGAACLLIASVFTVALINGGAWLALGLVGFIVWLVFVVITCISLLRGAQTP
jgi:hypothetical protein